MAEAGIFAEGERVELLEGEVYVMTPQNARHMRVIDRLSARLTRAGRGPVRAGADHAERRE